MLLPTLGYTFLIILLIDIALRIYFGRKALELLEKSPPFHVEPVPPQKHATPFELLTADGLTLRGGIFHPEELPPQGIVVFCPETIGTHWSVVRYCQALIEQGFLVVSFDFRNQGESDSLPGYESRHWVTEYEVGDLLAVVDWLQDQEAFRGLPIGLMGVSRGASTALVALARRNEIQCVCSDSGYTNDLLISHYLERWAPMVLPRIVMVYSRKCLWHLKWTLYAAAWIRSFKRKCKYILSPNPFDKARDKRVLLIVGKRDSYVPPRIAERLQKLLGDSAEMWQVSKAAHNGARTAAPEEYDRRIVAFFQEMVTTAATPVQQPRRIAAARNVRVGAE